MDLFIIAWKNIFRNKRRSVLTIISLVVGIVILTLALGWIRGYFTTLYGGIIRFDTGHIQILRNDYMKERQKLPLDLSVNSYEELRHDLSTLDGVAAVAGRIDTTARLGDGRRTLPLRLRAVDPGPESAITVIDEHIISGDYLETGDTGVVIGSGIAEKLGLEAGDSVYLRVRDRYDAPNLVAVPVRGIFRLGYPLMDEGMAFCSLNAAFDFLRMEGMVSRLVLMIEEDASLAKLLSELSAQLPKDLSAHSWRSFAQSLVKAVQADSISFTLFMLILALMIFLNILNTMSMTVRERGREIGTLRAIGMKRSQLKHLLYAESSIVALIASLIAIFIAAGLAWYLQYVGIDFSSSLPEDLPIPFGERFRADYRVWDFLAGIIFSTLTSFVGTILPARRAARQSVVETIRSSAF